MNTTLLKLSALSIKFDNLVYIMFMFINEFTNELSQKVPVGQVLKQTLKYEQPGPSSTTSLEAVCSRTFCVFFFCQRTKLWRRLFTLITSLCNFKVLHAKVRNLHKILFNLSATATLWLHSFRERVGTLRMAKKSYYSKYWWTWQIEPTFQEL